MDKNIYELKLHEEIDIGGYLYVKRVPGGCPYSHVEKECGHELHGPEGFENAFSVWCACGFRGPVFCLDPNELELELKMKSPITCQCGNFEPRVVDQIETLNWRTHQVERSPGIIVCKNCGLTDQRRKRNDTRTD